MTLLLLLFTFSSSPREPEADGSQQDIFSFIFICCNDNISHQTRITRKWEVLFVCYSDLADIWMTGNAHLAEHHLLVFSHTSQTSLSFNCGKKAFYCFQIERSLLHFWFGNECLSCLVNYPLKKKRSPLVTLNFAGFMQTPASRMKGWRKSAIMCDTQCDTPEDV